MIALVTPMKREAASVRRSLRGTPWEASITWRASGVGREAASGCISSLAASRYRPGMVISLGFAGAARGELAPGDLVLSSHTHALGGGEAIGTDQRLLRLAEDACQQAGLRYRVASTLTVPGPVLRGDHKAALGDMTGAWAINMEDYWLAAGAAAAGIPFLPVRSVLDTASQDLPPFVASAGSKDTAGQVVTALQTAVLSPWLLPGLLRLRRQDMAARDSLAAFALAFLPIVVATEQYQVAHHARGER